MWRERVAAWRASGLKLAEFCRGQEYTASGLGYWVRRLGRDSGRGGRAGKSSVSLVRVVRTAPSKTAPQSSARGGTGTARGTPDTMLVLELGALSVRVPAHLEDKVLAALFSSALPSAGAGAP